MIDVLRLFTRNFTSTRFDTKTAQIASWFCSCLVFLVGTLKLTRLQLSEVELIFGLLLVLAVTLLGLIIGLLMPIVEFVAKQQKNH